MASQTEYIYNKPSNIDNCKKWYQPEYHENMADWWPFHKDLKWRDDDVIICTSPRSGTHLMANMAMMILSQDIQKTLEYQLQNIGISWFTFKDDQDGRRVLGSHVDMEAMVKKVSDFLDVKLSMEKIKEITEGCSLENMRKAAVSDVLKNAGKDGNTPEFIGKRKRDDWKNHFTVALKEKFDSEIARRMQGSKTKIPNL